MVTVHCDNCQRLVEKDFPAGVVVRIGKRIELRFHLCDECGTALEGRVVGMLSNKPKFIVPGSGS